MTVCDENNAKEKWCPFGRIGFTGRVGGPVNIVVDIDNKKVEHWSKCIGSECMAWRWDWVFDERGKNPQHGGQGYCGLAGQ